jgi:hypothetical protein
MRLARRPAEASQRPPLRLVSTTPTPAPVELISRSAMLWAAGAAVVLGVLVRLSYVMAYDFPLNDGGLFFAMTRDLQAAGYGLPDATSYNGDAIPYAYPPLAFYVAAALNDAFGLSLTNIYRWTPLAANVAMLPAFFLLARRLLPTRFSAAAAAMMLALLPRAFLWMIMGGGITRSFGFTFAVLAIWALTAAYQDRRWRYVALAALFGALSLLSHLQMAWFVAFSAAILCLVYARDRFGFTSSLGAAALTAALASPWWVAVLAKHGPGPFLAAARSSDITDNPLVVFLRFGITSELLFPVIGALGLVGVLLVLSQRHVLLPLWLLASLTFDQRGFGTVAAIPLALLAGLAVEHLWTHLRHDPTAPDGMHAARVPAWLLPAVATAVIPYMALAAIVSGGRLLTAMSPDEREAVAWVAANTPPSSRVLVISDDRWASDRTSEWLPYLAARRSVATVQGYEWAPGSQFASRLSRYKDVQACARKTTACLDAWSVDHGIGFDYVYVPKLSPRATGLAGTRDEACCAALLQSLAGDARYAIVYDGGGAVVYARRGASEVTPPAWTPPR